VLPVQLTPQLPPVHVAVPVPLAGPGQGVHEVPHDLGLELSEQVPLQLWVAPVHPHCALLQCMPPLHANAAPQPPQLLSSLDSLVQPPAQAV
jgi:hypothetical protein